jgi:DNA-binding transcriptional regulator YhcF (GntR family)
MVAMKLSFKIKKDGPDPAYRQIVEQIIALIRTGRLKTGEKLPSERRLAESLGVARGTIIRAYAELGRMGVLMARRGHGTVISLRLAPDAPGRKDKAISHISSCIDALVEIRFTFPQMKAMFDLAILDREEALIGLNVAAVDCNPETLEVFERQIGLLSRVSVRKFLLDEIAGDSNPTRRLGDFDLILSTPTHQEELARMIPDLSGRIAAVAFSPSRETVMSLAALSPGGPIGVLCESRKFLSIVELRLKELRITGAVAALFPPRAHGELKRFIEDRRVLIIPPAGKAGLTREEARALELYTQGGGRIIHFDYRIEHGSLVYVEERIRALVERKSAETETGK